MKHFFILLIILCNMCSCNSQPDTKKLADKTVNAIETARPGTIPTSSDGWTIKAKVNGKDWVASSVMPPEAAGRIIGYYDKEYIGLPYDRRYFVVGKKIVFGEDQAVDLSTNDEIGIWGGRKGEMEITKVAGDWAEGKFYFTATSTRSSKSIEVTAGFFRIQIGKTN